MTKEKKEKLISIAAKKGFWEGIKLGYKYPKIGLSNMNIAVGIAGGLASKGLLSPETHTTLKSIATPLAKYTIPILAGTSLIGGIINSNKKSSLMRAVIEKNPDFPYDYVDAIQPENTPAGKVILRERSNRRLRRKYGVILNK